MNQPHVAYLASEIPSVSATFVYREILALRNEGVSVTPFSIHPVDPDDVSPDGRRFLAETDTVYGDSGRLLLGFLHMFERHPIRTLAVLGLAVRDLVFGTFSSNRQRIRLLVQAVAGLSLSPRLESAGVSHLHIHFAHSPATVGMYAALGANISFSVTSHANDIYVEASLLAEKISRAKAFVTISEANQRFFREQLGSIGEKVELVHCGVDLNDFAPSKGSSASTVPLVFALGRLVPKKGFDLLLRAFAEVVKTIPNAQLRLAGDGPQRVQLTELTDNLGLTENTTFLGAIAKDEVRRELGNCDTFVLPCRIDPDGGDVDGIPVCLMEAMACGIPVVSSPISGIPELIENDDTGFLVNSEDIDELATAISRLLSSGQLREQIGARGRAFVDAEFNAMRNAQSLAKLMLATPNDHAPGDVVFGGPAATPAT